jgi:hypothetical protein
MTAIILIEPNKLLYIPIFYSDFLISTSTLVGCRRKREVGFNDGAEQEMRGRTGKIIKLSWSNS